jgi:hypothetical protein
LPFEHRAFYGRILQQLVDAGELPVEIKEHFEEIFSVASDYGKAPRSAQMGAYGINERFALETLN